MTLKSIVKAHFQLNGQKPAGKKGSRFQDLLEGHGVDKGSVSDAVTFIASATGKSDMTIWNWLRQAEKGIGTEPSKLDPTIAMTLMWLSNQMLVDNERPMADDQIADYLMPMLKKYYKKQLKPRRSKPDGNRRKRKSGS